MRRFPDKSCVASNVFSPNPTQRSHVKQKSLSDGVSIMSSTDLEAHVTYPASSFNAGLSAAVGGHMDAKDEISSLPKMSELKTVNQLNPKDATSLASIKKDGVPVQAFSTRATSEDDQLLVAAAYKPDASHIIEASSDISDADKNAKNNSNGFSESFELLSNVNGHQRKEKLLTKTLSDNVGIAQGMLATEKFSYQSQSSLLQPTNQPLSSLCERAPKTNFEKQADPVPITTKVKHTSSFSRIPTLFPCLNSAFELYRFLSGPCARSATRQNRTASKT